MADQKWLTDGPEIDLPDMLRAIKLVRLGARAEGTTLTRDLCVALCHYFDENRAWLCGNRGAPNGEKND